MAIGQKDYFVRTGLKLVHEPLDGAKAVGGRYQEVTDSLVQLDRLTTTSKLRQLAAQQESKEGAHRFAAGWKFQSCLDYDQASDRRSTSRDHDDAHHKEPQSPWKRAPIGIFYRHHWTLKVTPL